MLKERERERDREREREGERHPHTRPDDLAHGVEAQLQGSGERKRERERGERGPPGVTILGDHSGATRGDTFGNGPGRKRPKVLYK